MPSGLPLNAAPRGWSAVSLARVSAWFGSKTGTWCLSCTGKIAELTRRQVGLREGESCMPGSRGAVGGGGGQGLGRPGSHTRAQARAELHHPSCKPFDAADELVLLNAFRNSMQSLFGQHGLSAVLASLQGGGPGHGSRPAAHGCRGGGDTGAPDRPSRHPCVLR